MLEKRRCILKEVTRISTLKIRETNFEANDGKLPVLQLEHRLGENIPVGHSLEQTTNTLTDTF